MEQEAATQMTANVGILQAVVMMASGCAVWPSVVASRDSAALPLGPAIAGDAPSGTTLLEPPCSGPFMWSLPSIPVAM